MFYKQLSRVKFERLLEKNCLVAVMQYVAFRFLQTTMFGFVFSNSYKFFTIGLLILSGGIRFIYILRSEIKKQKRIGGQYAAHYWVIGILSMPFIYVGWKHDYKFLVFIPLVSLCLYRIDFKTVLRWFIWTIGILLAGTVLCALTGTVRNLVYNKGRIVGAYGILNTTDFASYITFLLLYIWCIQRKLLWWESLCFSFIVGIVNFGAYWISESRTALYCGILTVALILWCCLEEIIKKKNKKALFGQRIKYVFTLAFPCFCLVFLLLMVLYSQDNSIAQQINALTNGRLSVCARAFEQYGIHAYGSTITSMHGAGATLIHFDWNVNGYGYIDAAYAMIAIRYGWVILLVISLLWTWMAIRATRSGEYKVTFAMLVIAFHALSEAKFIDLNYNILLAMPFCSFGIPDKPVQKLSVLNKENSCGKVQFFNIVSAVVMVAIVMAISPRLMSWLRSIFYIKGWNVGIHACGALVISIIIILLVILFWKSICMVWHRWCNKFFSFCLLVFLFFSIGVVMGNSIIEKGIIERKERLNLEEEVIRLVQSSAKNPVYAAELSELYQRTIGGFSEHSFSTEELKRSDGTIIVDVETDATSIMMMGGWYIQISPWSGVYTFDKAVVDALSSAGYDCKQYYYSERVADLADIAIRNGLSQDKDGRIIIHGSEQSIRENIEYDQFTGSYEVKFILTVSEKWKNIKDICTLYVKGEAKDRLIIERTMTVDDFNENGISSVILSYNIISTPKVSYLIEVADGVTLYVDKISWKRVS